MLNHDKNSTKKSVFVSKMYRYLSETIGQNDICIYVCIQGVKKIEQSINLKKYTLDRHLKRNIYSKFFKQISIDAKYYDFYAPLLGR